MSALPGMIEKILARQIDTNHGASEIAKDLIKARQSPEVAVSFTDLRLAFKAKLSNSGLEKAAEGTVDYFCSLAENEGELIFEEMFKLCALRDGIEAFIRLGISFPQSVETIDQAFMYRIRRQRRVAAMALSALRKDWKSDWWWYQRPPKPPSDLEENAQ